jgi:hypothetical protein
MEFLRLFTWYVGRDCGGETSGDAAFHLRDLESIKLPSVFARDLKGSVCDEMGSSSSNSSCSSLSSFQVDWARRKSKIGRLFSSCRSQHKERILSGLRIISTSEWIVIDRRMLSLLERLSLGNFEKNLQNRQASRKMLCVSSILSLTEISWKQQQPISWHLFWPSSFDTIRSFSWSILLATKITGTSIQSS